MHIYMLVTNCYQILKRASEGITERDGAGRTADGAFDLHRPRWMWNRREKARHVKREPGSYKMEPDSLKKGSLGARLIKEWLHFVKREPFSFMFKEV